MWETMEIPDSFEELLTTEHDDDGGDWGGGGGGGNGGGDGGGGGGGGDSMGWLIDVNRSSGELLIQDSRSFWQKFALKGKR